jgi:DNA-binding FrmR family transcriptional regulator
MGHLHSNSEALVKRVRRIAGQVGAVERALTEGEDCATTLHLVAAVRGAVNGLMEQILEAHGREHVAHPDLTDAERQAGLEELLTAVRRYAR